MIKVYNFFGVIILSSLFLSCSSYQMASYYSDNDGIYVSNEKGVDYQVVFKDFANAESTDDYDSGNLPWGAKPESREIITNFFPSFGRFYYDPFNFNMGYNPFFYNNRSFSNYGFRSPFFYNSFEYGLGYPFYGHMNFHFSPYGNSFGNYYWYMMRNSRYNSWYNGGIYDNAYKSQDDEKNINPNRLSFSNSASRRGQKNSSTENSRRSDAQGVRISNLYSRSGASGRINVNRSLEYNDDRVNRRSSLREVEGGSLIGVYSRESSNQRNIVRNNNIPDLNAIKNEYVREAYKQVRSVGPNQRGNSFYRSSIYNNSGKPSPVNFGSSRRSGSDSYAGNRSNTYSGNSSRSSQGVRSSSSSSGSRGSRSGSGSGSRGGKIN